MYEECNREAGCRPEQAHYESCKPATPRSAQRRASLIENRRSINTKWAVLVVWGKSFTCGRSIIKPYRTTELKRVPRLTFPIGQAQSRPPLHWSGLNCSRVCTQKPLWIRCYMHARRRFRRHSCSLRLVESHRCCRAPIGIGRVVLESCALRLIVVGVEVPLLYFTPTWSILCANLLCHPPTRLSKLLGF